MAVGPDSPFAARFLAWVNERFALPNAILALALYLASTFYSAALIAPGKLPLAARDVGGFLGFWMFFLMLRVFDEHKDYEADCRDHPERVLQRGLVTLGNLKVAGAFAIAAQLSASLWRDGGVGRVTLWWLAVLGWSLLMLREFFVREWLRPRLLLYAFVHMLVTPLSLVWVAQMGTGGASLDPRVGWLAGLGFVAGAAFEIARKVRAPADERPLVDTYTKILGTTGAPVVILALLAAAGVIFVRLLGEVGGGRLPVGPAIALGVGLLLPVAPLVGFIRRPAAKQAKQIELLTSLAMLVGFVAFIVAAVSARGIAWQ